MALFLIVAFLVLPVAEIAVFIQVGDVIGLWPTLFGILFTAILGGMIVRHQGFETLQRARGALNRNELPVTEIFDGVCILFAGALLLTPGFLTDTLGFLLLVPPFRVLLRQVLWTEIQRRGGSVHVQRGGTGQTGGPGAPPGWGSRRSDGHVIEGEFTEVKDEDDRELPRGGHGSQDNPWGPRQ